MDNNVTQHKRVHYKGISRIDSKTTKGWLVRGYKNGKRYSKLFSDRKIGSSEEALNQALTFCKELSARLKAIPADPRAKKIVYSDVRNTTGVIGISRLTKPGKNGSKLEFYSVTWRPAPGEQKCTSFSIRKYGPEEAFRKAVVCRYNGLEKLHGRDIAVRIVGEDNVKKYVLNDGVEKTQDKEIEMRATNEISAKARTASTVTA